MSTATWTHLADLPSATTFADGRPYWTSQADAVRAAREFGYDVCLPKWDWQAPTAVVGSAVYEARMVTSGRFAWVLT